MAWLALALVVQRAGGQMETIGARHTSRLRGAIMGKNKSDVIDSEVLTHVGEIFDPPSDADSTYRPGPNGAGTLGYVGPQPPAGHGPHHYYFWVYALDTKVDGTPTREEFLSTYGPHIVEQNRLVGSFENQPSDAVQ
jgi:hypothetical protein